MYIYGIYIYIYQEYPEIFMIYNNQKHRAILYFCSFILLYDEYSWIFPLYSLYIACIYIYIYIYLYVS